MKKLSTILLIGIAALLVGCDLSLVELVDGGTPAIAVDQNPNHNPDLYIDPTSFDDCTRTENSKQGFCGFTCPPVGCTFYQTRTVLSITAQDTGSPCLCHVSFGSSFQGSNTLISMIYEYNLAQDNGSGNGNDTAKIFVYGSDTMKVNTAIYESTSDKVSNWYKFFNPWAGNGVGLDITLERESRKSPKISTFTLYNLSIQDTSPMAQSHLVSY